MKKLIFILACSSFLVNCQRAQKKSTQVQIILPGEKSSASALSADGKVVDLSSGIDSFFDDPVTTSNTNSQGILRADPGSMNPSLDVNSWAKIDANGYEGTTDPITCYMVLAHDTSATTASGNYCSGGGNSVINFEKYVGPAPAGNTLSIDLNTETTYTFTILGFRAPNAAADCKDVVAHLDKTKLSAPYKVISVDRAITNDSQINLTRETFSAGMKMNDCTFSGHSIAGDSALLMPAGVRVVKDEFPEGVFAQNPSLPGACFPLSFYMINSAGDVIESPSTAPTVSLYATQPSSTVMDCKDQLVAGCTAGSARKTYATQQLCEAQLATSLSFAQTNGDDTFNMSHSTVRWFASGASATSSMSYMENFHASVIGLADGPPIVVRAKSNSSSLHDNAFDIVGPQKVEKDQCSTYNILTRFYAGYLSTTYTTRSLKVSTANGAEVYSSQANCLTGSGGTRINDSSTSIDFSSAIGYVGSLYIKFKASGGDGGGDTKEQITISEDQTVDTGGYLSGATVVTTVEHGGSTTPRQLKLLTNKHQLGAGSKSACMGPFYVALQNGTGAVVANSAGSISGKITFAPAMSDIQVFTTTNTSGLNCNGATVPLSSYNFAIAGNSNQSAPFYLQMPSVSSTASGDYKMTVTDSASVLLADSIAVNLNNPGH